MSNIRSVAIALIRRDDELLLLEGFDTVKQNWFYRPPGGRIEFGEYGHETVAREFLEEMDAQLKDIRYLFTLENIFVHEGVRAHELVRVYEAAFEDKALHSMDEIECREDDGTEFKAKWLSPSFFTEHAEVRLVPEGLFDKLNAIL